jgi:hypothetical protein
LSKNRPNIGNLLRHDVDLGWFRMIEIWCLQTGFPNTCGHLRIPIFRLAVQISAHAGDFRGASSGSMWTTWNPAKSVIWAVAAFHPSWLMEFCHPIASGHVNSLRIWENGPFEIMDFPIKHGDFP